MGKALGPRTNFRVVIEPRRLGNFGSISVSDSFFYRGPLADERIAQEYDDRCREIAEQVRRHVDNVSHTSVEFDQEPVCQHCGSTWTESSDDYNGGCCAADEDAQLAREALTTQHPEGGDGQ
ncbi:hypothetical protein [Luteimonas saliphila]|uniref:hypothetical protein n=1 Tax=Luteimonas saliphila TaxID=2804919 RepID=UPI00192E21A0|nr:hypothetical protein [Luteimonas saliphila]